MKTVNIRYYVLLAILSSFAIILSSSGEIKSGGSGSGSVLTPVTPATSTNNAATTATTVNKITSVIAPTPTTMSVPVQPSLNVILVDQDAQAKNHAATVHVTLSGISLIEPGGQFTPGQGHIHYQLDNHPVVATTATDLSFHHLTSGTHKIVVSLAGNDHTPIGPSQTLSFQIP